VLVDAIKTFVGSFDEETESVYLGNGTRKTQIETVPIVYSSYSSSVFRNQYNTTTTAEHSIDKDNSVVLSHRLNTKGTKHRYYIVQQGLALRRVYVDQVHQSVVLSRYYGNDRVLQNAFCGRGQGFKYRDVFERVERTQK
jgi:hypothetical protein